MSELNMSKPRQNLALCVVKVAAIVVAVGALSLALRPENYLVDLPLTEDGYYSLTVARNIAAGRGITIDGTTWTNGFQPLWVFVCVPAFAVARGDRFIALRLVLLWHWVFYVATAFLLGLIARDFLRGEDSRQRGLAAWLAAYVYLTASYVFLPHFNGLETGCLLFLYTVAWRYYQTGRHEHWRGLATYGAILGLVVLARIDAVFLVIILSFYQILSSRQSDLWQRLGRFATLSGMAFLISSPWWFYNLTVFNSLMPTSGQAQQAWGLSLMRLDFALDAIVHAAAPWHYLTLPGRVVFIAAATLLSLKLRPRRGSALAPGTVQPEYLRRTMTFGGCLLLTAFSLLTYYLLAFSSDWAYGRYFAPALLVSTLAISYLLLQISCRIPRVTPVLAFGLILPLTLWAGLFHTRTLGDRYTFYPDALELIRELVPAGQRVGAGQSGTLGYFREGVVNLDGKVNPKALPFQQNMWVYLREADISWFCDWPENAEAYLGRNPETHGWKLVGKKGQFLLYHHEASER